MTGRPVGGELERLRRIDRLCESVEQRWKRGERPRIEDSLGDSSAEDRPVLLSELLLLEWSYRRSSGERFVASEYAARFPDQTRVVEEAWDRWLGGVTAVANSVAPETVVPLPNPTHRPARSEELADAP